MTLQELNREYFELYGELYNARTLLPHKQYKSTVEALQKAYADDLERVLLTKELSIGRERFELRFQVHNWLPRRRFVLWWNKVAKALTRRYTQNLPPNCNGWKQRHKKPSRSLSRHKSKRKRQTPKA